MHRRMITAMVAATLVLPTSIAAQARPGQDEVVLISGLRLSPFVGFLTPFTRNEEWVFDEGGQSAFVQTEMKLAGGTVFGAQLEAPLSRRFGFTGAAAYASRGDTEFGVFETGDAFRIDGNHIFLVRAGAGLYLNEAESELVMRRLNASLFAGGVVMHERPRSRLGSGESLSSGTHFGLNLGVNAEVPFADDRFAIQLGLEDNMLWWSEGPMRSLAYTYFGQPGTTEESTSVRADASHLFMLRAGLQFRF